MSDYLYVPAFSFTVWDFKPIHRSFVLSYFFRCSSRTRRQGRTPSVSKSSSKEGDVSLINPVTWWIWYYSHHKMTLFLMDCFLLYTCLQRVRPTTGPGWDLPTRTRTSTTHPSTALLCDLYPSVFRCLVWHCLISFAMFIITVIGSVEAFAHCMLIITLNWLVEAHCIS
jgi:hypothetical protein